MRLLILVDARDEHVRNALAIIVPMLAVLGAALAVVANRTVQQQRQPVHVRVRVLCVCVNGWMEER